MKNPGFIKQETVETRAEALARKHCPGVNTRVLNAFMPLLVRLVSLEEQNA